LRGRAVEDLATAEAAEVVHLTKAQLLTTALSSGMNAELNVVNKNGNYETLVWTTTPANIKKALRAGVFASKTIQNRLTKAVAHLGLYKQLMFSRSVEEGFVVKHNNEKLAIVDFTQDCIEALQPLYESINNFDVKGDPKQNLVELLTKLDNLSDKLTAIENSNERYGSVDSLLYQIKEYKSQLIASNEDTEFTQADMLAMLRPYANPYSYPDLSLQHFLQEQLNTMLTNALEENYLVSGLFQDYSGLQKIITETQFITENFSSEDVDYHTPVTARHAFEFDDAKVAVNGLVTMDMQRFGVVPGNKLALAKLTTLIKRIDEDKPFFSPTDQVYGFFGINWSVSATAPLVWFANGMRNILSTAADVLYLIGKAVFDSGQRLSGVKPPPVNFPSGYIFTKRDISEEKYSVLPENQKIYDINNPITKIPHFSLLEQLYSGATTIIARYVLEPVVALSDVVVDEVWHLKTVKKIWYDSTVGTKPINETDVGMLLEQRIKERRANEAANEVSQTALIDSYKTLYSHSDIQSYDELSKHIEARKAHLPGAVSMPYHLTPDQPGDLLNFIFGELGKDIVEFFSHEVYRGHPVTGLAFSIAAGSAAPMLTPVLMNNVLLATINQNVSVPIAQFFVGETSGLLPGITTALLQGKIAYLAVDIFNGRNSLLNYGVKGLLENPVIATVVTTAAISFGYVLAYDMNVPWLSDKIAKETSKASFPYFELGLSGAKIAAVLVEGTLNLHQEENHLMNDHFIDSAVDPMRDEITSAMRQGYMRAHGIAEDKLQQTDLDQITQQVTEYCAHIKIALKKPEVAEQISQLSHTIGTLVGVDNPANFNGVLAKFTDENTQQQLALFLQRRKMRHQIALLDPLNLSEKDKYVILNYLAQTYPDDADYVASVRSRFEQDQKYGWFGETIKVIASYPGMLLRAILASVRYLGYRAMAFINEQQGNLIDAKQKLATANHATYPIRDLGRKIKNDLGLLVKASAALFRDVWGLCAGVVLMPLTIVTAGPVAIFSSKWSVKIYARINRVLFAPGRVNQFIDLLIGVMRSDAGSKNLTLITQSVDIRSNRKILVPTLSPATSAVNPDVLLPERLSIDLDQALFKMIKEQFNLHESLRALVNPAPKRLQDLTQNIERAIALVEPHPTFFLFGSRKDQFRSELKNALLQVHDQINHLTGVSQKDKLAQQKMIKELLQTNKREPLIEFKNAYRNFTRFDLPKQPTHTALQTIYTKLKDAQNSVLTLKVIYDNKSQSSRSQVVVDMIKQNSCLSLQVVREIAGLRKVMAWVAEDEKLHNIAEVDSDLPKAKKLLDALMQARRSARIAAHKFAVNQPVLEALTTLHVPEAPVLNASPKLSNGVNGHSNAKTTGRVGILPIANGHGKENKPTVPAITASSNKRK
jgi:hypothetical protein